MLLRDVSLKKYNTFGLECKADYLITLNSEEDAIALFKNRESIGEPVLILGGGSNLLFINDFKGTVIHPIIGGIAIEEQKNDYVIVSSGAGIIWDDFVLWTVKQGYGGLENLSLIPGMVGATPVQNIGAYGTEVRETIVRVKTVSVTTGEIKEFSNEECMFSYRDSIFKNELKGKYLVTRVFFRLAAEPLFNISHASLKEEVEKIGKLSLETIRQTVINIRREKLPDPDKTGNAGSFFKNPVVSSAIADDLISKYPCMPVYKVKEGGMKIAAGWLIDECGWKGKRVGNAGVYDRQALVLVNHGNATGEEILDLSESIRKSVINKFGIELQREVEVIGSI